MLGSGRGGDGRTRIRGSILVEFCGVGDILASMVSVIVLLVVLAVL